MPNLGHLSAISEGSLTELLGFSLQGIAGPSGRPLSLLSFAFQHESWPSNPASFKHVNVLIHLLNGTLVLWLVMLIQRARQAQGSSQTLLPVVAATIWLVWPVHVSAVLYVVQRMTLLSATCMLLGLILFVSARLADREGRTTQAAFLFLISLGVGTALGILFKENAIVFPLLALALNATMLNSMPRPMTRGWRWLLWTPLILFIAYLLQSSSAFGAYEVRNFTLWERLLTESRVVWMYVAQIIIPTGSSLRFLYDDYPISTGLLSPVSTLIALITLFTSAVCAWAIRRKWPALAFAVLFFLASQAIESTVLPLELVFEHRNYIGSVAFAVAIAYALWGLSRSQYRSGKALGTIALTSYLLVTCFVSLGLIALWGNPMLQKRFWYEQNPDSPRVHMELASQFLLEGYADAGAAQLEASANRFPRNMGFPIARAELACYYPELRPASLHQVQESIHAGDEDPRTAIIFLDRLTSNITNDLCPAYSAQEVLSLLAAAQGNKAFKVHAQDLYVLTGSLQSSLGNSVEARRNLERAISMKPTARLLIQAATWEIGNQNFSAARAHLDDFELLAHQQPLKYLALRHEATQLRNSLEQSARANDASN